jgi:exoribonuclease R
MSADSTAMSDDLRSILARGFDQIRHEQKVPAGFPDAVVAAADAAARRPLGSEHVDRTDVAFVTLDPATSTDLDQAFALEASGHDLVLRYAIADVPWFVQPGDALDTEAWQRGLTLYLPDAKAPVYPPALSEHAASLLPDGPRPSIVFAVRVDPEGNARLDGVERAVIRSRAKLGYETASASDLPPQFDEFAARIASAEDRRGASRADAPEQEVVSDGGGRYRLELRPRLSNEDANAAMSLATNLAVADALYAAGTGLFRVMPEPDERAVRRLRFTARALGIAWDDHDDLKTMQRRLHPNDPKHAAFLIAVRRATGGASYAAFDPNVKPWHAAMAATYSHATAPLRRLADRYVIEAALAVANGQPVPEHVTEAFTRLPEVMDTAENRSSQVERAVLDLVESVVLLGHEGDVFSAVVTDTDDRGARIQLCDMAVTSRVAAHRVEPGDDLTVRLVATDPLKRQSSFERVS